MHIVYGLNKEIRERIQKEYKNKNINFILKNQSQKSGNKFHILSGRKIT